MKNINKLILVLASILCASSHCADKDIISKQRVKFSDSLQGEYARETLESFSVLQPYFFEKSDPQLIDCNDFLSQHNPSASVFLKQLLDTYQKLNDSGVVQPLNNLDLEKSIAIFQVAHFMGASENIIDSLAKVVKKNIVTSGDFLANPKGFLKGIFNSPARETFKTLCHTVLPITYNWNRRPGKWMVWFQPNIMGRNNDPVFMFDEPNEKFITSKGGNSHAQVRLKEKRIEYNYRIIHHGLPEIKLSEIEILPSEKTLLLVHKKTNSLRFYKSDAQNVVIDGNLEISPDEVLKTSCIVHDYLACMYFQSATKPHYLSFLSLPPKDNQFCNYYKISDENTSHVSQLEPSATGKYLLWKNEEPNQPSSLIIFDILNKKVIQKLPIIKNSRITTCQADDDVYAITVPDNSICMYRVNSNSKTPFVTLSGSHAPCGEQQIAIYKNRIADNYGNQWDTHYIPTLTTGIYLALDLLASDISLQQRRILENYIASKKMSLSDHVYAQKVIKALNVCKSK